MNAKPHGVIRSAFNSLAHKTCLSGAEDNGHAIGEAFMHTLLGWIITADAIMEPLGLVLSLYPLYYYFRGMRRVYPEGAVRTVAKFTLLSSSYLVVAVLAFIATAVYSALAQ